MKNIFTLVCALFLTIVGAQAQTKIFGTVVDTTGTTLTGATVMVLQAKDSLLSGFALVDVKGAFEIAGVKAGNYVLQLSFLGYGMKKIPITLADEKEKDLGKIVMKEQTSTLNEYVVEGERTPMTMKKDTVEFNAAAFKVQPNSTVEELLKRLPGVEVEKDGNVKAQGESVTRVLVNGKEFFGRDPKTATRNLPADAIDKIQVFDKMTDVAEFTGVDDGQREKTINLTLRPDRQNGVFGNFRAGTGGRSGADGLKQFDLGGNLNRFSKTGQLSFIGSANNINKNGFSINEYLDFSGGGGGGFGGGGGGGGGFGGGGTDAPINFGRNYGFTTFYSTGVNFSRDFSKKTKLNGSYLYSGFKKETDKRSSTENFLEKSSFIQKDTSQQEERSNVHRLNFTLDHQLDSTQSIRVVSRLSLSNNGNDLISNSFSTNELNLPRNSSDQNSVSNGENINLNNSLLYRKRFSRQGRSLSTTFTLNNVFGNSDGTNLSKNLFFGTDGALTRTQLYDQINNVNNDRTSYNGRLSFTEPLSRGKFLELNYSYNHRGNDNNREVYDVTPTGQILNVSQTNHILSDFNFHNAGFNFRIANPKLNFSTGLAIQQAKLEGDLLTSEQTVKQEFTNLLPSLRLRYNFSSMRSFNFDYSTDINEPSVTQLQPVRDISNPLSIYIGNPNLKPEYSNRFTVRYNHFNQFNFTNFFSFANLTYTHNRIQTAQTINLETLVTERTPINVSDDYRFISRLNYGGRFKGLKTRFNLSGGFNYNWGITFVNAARNNTKTMNPTAGITFDNQKKEKWDWNLGYTINYSNTAYSLNSERNQDYYTYTYTAGVRKFFLKDKLNIETDLDYNQFRGLGAAYNQDIPIWNAAISMYFLKANKGQLKLGMYDILNQNKGISRTVQLNSFQDQNVSSLARYFMLSFIYSVKGFQKSNNNNQMNMRMMR